MTLSNKKKEKKYGTRQCSNFKCEEAKDTTKNTKDDGVKETDKKVEEKKYTDKELNDISLKNEQKALAKQLKDLKLVMMGKKKLKMNLQT